MKNIFENIVTEKEPYKQEISPTEKKPKVFTLENMDMTPMLKEGAIVVLGRDPLAAPLGKGVVGAFKIEGDLKGQLSRQAVEIANAGESGYRFRLLSTANVGRVYATDRDLVEAQLSPGGNPLGEDIWEKMGEHCVLEIETKNETFIRVRRAGGRGAHSDGDSQFQFRIEISKDRDRNGLDPTMFEKLNETIK